MNALPGRPASHHPAPGRRRPAAARARVLLGLAALVLALTGCGVRVDAPPTEPEPPDAVETTRQDAARSAEQLAGTTLAVEAADEALTAELALVGGAASTHLQALGGFWEPWPDGAPEDAEHVPEPAPSALADPTPQEVLALLVDGASSAREQALSVPDADLAALLTSIAVSRTWAAVDLARLLGVDVELGTGAPLPVDALAGWRMDSGTVLVLDAGRYTYEVVAARTGGGERNSAAARADHLRALTEAAVALGGEDPRRAAYALDEDPGVGTAPEHAMAAGAEQRLMGQWVFRVSLTSPADRGPLLDAAVHAAGRARAWGGVLPALPGLG